MTEHSPVVPDAPPPAAAQVDILTPQDIRLLTEIGFLAAGVGDVVHADVIFGALHRLRPERAFPGIGRALSYLNAGRAGEAVRLLEQARSPDPQEQALLDVWRGLALQLAGLAGQSRTLLETVAGEPDGEAARLAQVLLGRSEQATDNSFNIDASLVTGI